MQAVDYNIIVALSRIHCCHGKATVLSPYSCMHVAVSSVISTESVVMEAQPCVLCVDVLGMSLPTVYNTLGSQCEVLF